MMTVHPPNVAIPSSDTKRRFQQKWLPGSLGLILLVLGTLYCDRVAAADPLVLDLWSEKTPGETKDLPAEADQTKPDDPMIAGRPVIRLGNVSNPQLAVYRPTAETDTGAAVVVCPGGGHRILAYDLEGTQVAE